MCIRNHISCIRHHTLNTSKHTFTYQEKSFVGVDHTHKYCHLVTLAVLILRLDDELRVVLLIVHLNQLSVRPW